MLKCSSGLSGAASPREDGGLEEGRQHLGQGAQQGIQETEAGAEKENRRSCQDCQETEEVLQGEVCNQHSVLFVNQKVNDDYLEMLQH